MMDREMIDLKRHEYLTRAVSRSDMPEPMTHPLEHEKWLFDQGWNSALSALNEAGCVVVPKVPTEAMLDAASDAMSDIEDYSTTRVEYAAAVYTAMLTAAQGDGTDG